MVHRWKNVFFVLFLWYAVFAFCFWTTSGSGSQLASYTRGLSYLMGLLRLSPALQEWVTESYAANMIFCPPTLVCLAFLAWRKRLPPGHLAKIGLFLAWQIAITLVALFAFKTEILPDMIGQIVESIIRIESWWRRVSLIVYLTLFVSTLPVHCVALWYCLFRKPKETTTTGEIEVAQPA